MFFAAMLGMLTAVALGAGCVLGMGCVFLRVFVVGTFVVRVLVVDFRAGRSSGGRCLDRGRDRRFRLVFLGVGFARGMIMVVVIAVRIMRMLVRMFMIAMVMMLRIDVVMFGLVRVIVGMFALPMIFMRLSRLRRIGACVLDDLALDAFAIAAAARVAMTRTAAAAGTVFGFFFGFAMSALIGLDQRLAIGYRNLIIVRVDFAESQEAVAVAAIFDKGGLQ
jgi:hypothetical protein